MKKKDLQSLRNKKIESLEKQVSELKKDLDMAHLEIKMGRENNTSKVKNTKRDIAQIMTIIREKQILKKMSKDKKENK